MPAPVAIRSQYSDLFGSSMLPVLEEIFRSEYAQHPMQREKLFNVKSTTRDIWQFTEVHDMDLFSQMAEGQEYSFKRPKQGASRTLTIAKYGLGASISEEAVDDGKFDFVADMVRKMGRSGRESQEINAMNVFNNGFSTEVANDGLALFHASHTLPSGGTFRNKLTVDSDLSGTSLDTMLYDFETQNVGDSGIIEHIMPKILLVNPIQRRYALELIGSSLKADTADNNMNSFANEGLTVVSSPHLTDTDAWFLLADKPDHGLRIINRKSIETKAAGPDLGFTTDSILYKSRYREAIGVAHAKGVFGTPGA
jgi:hypothetical protein